MARSMQLGRWEPFRDLLNAQRDLDQLFGRGFDDDIGLRGSWSPAMDIHESDQAFTVWMDVPGMSSDDIDITLDRNLLTVRGERSFSTERREEDFRRVERRTGAFERSVTLPSHVDAEGINASVTDGVLEIVIPKAEEAKPRQIKVGQGTRQLNA